MSGSDSWGRVVLIIGLNLISVRLHAADADFATVVSSTRPLAFYRLDASAGKSQAGTTQYKASGGVANVGGGVANGRYCKLNGRDGYIVTTQSGGVSGAASIMAWVNLDTLPGEERHFFYVAGESQYGNDLDLQFETDNELKFYRAAGGHLTYAPQPNTMLHQWHMIVATMDTPTQTRVLYWDGKSVATDKGGGQPNKSGVFSIGESMIFKGRFLKGGIQEVALWNHALQAAEVAAIYAAAQASSAHVTNAGSLTTTAKVEVADGNGPVALKPEEQIAIMFLNGIQLIESDCQRSLQRACTLDQLVAGPVAPDGTHLRRLKFDPKSDTNYTYTVAAGEMVWEAHANPTKRDLKGFYFYSRSFPDSKAHYRPGGEAGIVDKELLERSIDGDSFAVR